VWTSASVRTEREFQLSVKFLDLVERDLVLTLVLLLGCDLLTLNDLAGQCVITDENVHRIS
jgi:hypothetical protein